MSGTLLLTLGFVSGGCDSDAFEGSDVTTALDTTRSDVASAQHSQPKSGEGGDSTDEASDALDHHVPPRSLEAESVEFETVEALIEHTGIDAELDVHELIDRVIASTRDYAAEREMFLLGLNPDEHHAVIVEFVTETPMPQLATASRIPTDELTVAEVAEVRQQLAAESRQLMERYELDLMDELAPVLAEMQVDERFTRFDYVPIGSAARVEGRGADIVEAIAAGEERIGRVEFDPGDTFAEPPRVHLATSIDQMNSEWMNAEYGSAFSGFYTYLGVVDTGVRTTHHNLLENFSLGAFARDCYYVAHAPGSGTCTDGGIQNYDPSDNCYDHGHKSVSVVGGSSGPQNYHPIDDGVTRLVVDSYKNSGGVGGCCDPNTSDSCRACIEDCGDFRPCPSGCATGYVSCTNQSMEATLRGLWAARQNLAQSVAIVAQFPDPQGYGVLFANAVRTLVNTQDTAIVAAAGNVSNGPCENNVQTQAYPAEFSRVLSIGHYNSASSSQTLLGFCQGPTADDRVYPDLVFPSRVNTASARHDYAATTYSGSSAATPHALGALALVRNRILDEFGLTHPGYAYATLLAGGETRQNTISSGNGGAGRYRSDGPEDDLFVGSVTLSHASSSFVPVPIVSGNCTADRIKAAFWWGEDPNERSYIVGQIRNNFGSSVQLSGSTGVFQRLEVELPSPYPTGDWTLYFHALQVGQGGPSGPLRTVYYAISLSDC